MSFREQPLTGKQPTFHREMRSGFSYRILLWVFLILGAVWINTQMNRGIVQPFFLPTFTPTRNAVSLFEELAPISMPVELTTLIQINPIPSKHIGRHLN
jgi:hypothetical protein